MEVGPVIQSHEAVSQPNLLEVFAEQQVTIFGVSGTFKDLAEMCPVDLNDASISVEAKNEFVVKAANEAGLEIEPKYEKVFTHHTEKLGLERKFTVAEKEMQPSKDVVDSPKSAETQVELPQSSHKVRHSEVETQHSVTTNLEQYRRLAEVVLEKEAEKLDSSRPTTRANVIPSEKPVVLVETRKYIGQRRVGVVSSKDERVVPTTGTINEVAERTVRKEQAVSNVIALPQENNNMAPDIPIKLVSQIKEIIIVDTQQADIVEALPVMIDEMAGEDFQLPTVEVIETIGLEDEMGGYNIFEEDEVVLLMSALEQGQVHVGESKEEAALDLGAQAVEIDSFLQRIIGKGEVVVVPELSAPIEQIEATISTLSEVFENAEYETMERFNQILEEIINLPEKIDVHEVSTGQKESIFEEKIEALFIELFEEVGIEYTPELLKSFIILTRSHYLHEIFVAAKMEADETFDLPDEIGTREFLQKLHHGLRAMKRAGIHLYRVGQSVLRLYGMSSAASMQAA